MEERFIPDQCDLTLFPGGPGGPFSPGGPGEPCRDGETRLLRRQTLYNIYFTYLQYDNF